MAKPPPLPPRRQRAIKTPPVLHPPFTEREVPTKPDNGAPLTQVVIDDTRADFESVKAVLDAVSPLLRRDIVQMVRLAPALTEDDRRLVIALEERLMHR
jgi:hypothetical protein